MRPGRGPDRRLDWPNYGVPPQVCVRARASTRRCTSGEGCFAVTACLALGHDHDRPAMVAAGRPTATRRRGGGSTTGTPAGIVRPSRQDRGSDRSTLPPGCSPPVSPFPIAIHRRAPWAALALTLGSLVAFSLLHYAPYPGISVFALLFAITLHSTRKATRYAFGATIAAFLVALAAQPPGVARPADWAATLLAATVAWLAGDNVRQRRARWAALEERTMLLEREREERDRAAVTAERLRIARELHDVVAHSMSVIAVQAGVGHHVIDTRRRRGAARPRGHRGHQPQRPDRDAPAARRAARK